MHPVKVSIVLPTYNQAVYLSKAISAILSQTFQNFELIVVNDGSTDDTKNILNAIKHPKIRLIKQENQGLPNALNKGFELARGEYWTWTSTDNIVAKNWLEELVFALDNSVPEVGYALSAYALIDDAERILHIQKHMRFDLPSLITRRVGGNASFLYRASLAKKVGGYDPSLVYAEDFDMWLRMASVTSAVLVDTVLYYYRVHQNAMTNETQKVFDATKKTIETFLLKTGGRFLIDQLFPHILYSKNQNLERFKSRIRLVTLSLDSLNYCGVDPYVDQMVEAISQYYDEKLIGNIVHLYVKESRWSDAKNIVEHYQKIHPSDYLSLLLYITENGDNDSLRKIPLLTMAEELLALDCDSERKPDEILKNLCPIGKRMEDTKAALFSHILTEFVNTLEDGKDHPEIWKAFSEFTSEDDQLRLIQLQSYISLLLTVPQEQRVRDFLEIIEAVCLAYTYKHSLAKSKLENVIQQTDLLAAKGALKFITENEIVSQF